MLEERLREVFRKHAERVLGPRSDVELSTSTAESDDIKAQAAGEDTLSNITKSGLPA